MIDVPEEIRDGVYLLIVGIRISLSCLKQEKEIEYKGDGKFHLIKGDLYTVEPIFLGGVESSIRALDEVVHVMMHSPCTISCHAEAQGNAYHSFGSVHGVFFDTGRCQESCRIF